MRKPSNNWKQLKLDVLQRSSKGKRECDRKIERNIEMSYAEIKAVCYNTVLRDIASYEANNGKSASKLLNEKKDQRLSVHPSGWKWRFSLLSKE